jgi:hypothetical protein
MIVVAIEVDAVEIDIVDAESEPYNLWLWATGRTKASASEKAERRTRNDTFVAIGDGCSGRMEGGEVRMCQVHPVVGRREAELRGVWSAAWMSASNDEREGRPRMCVE